MTKNQKIQQLFDKLLAEYKKAETAVITEYPSKDEAKELKKLGRKVDRYKGKLKNILEE